MTPNRRARPGGRHALDRKVEIRNPKKTLVVYCEGIRTEPEYLEALKKLPAVRTAAAVELRIESQESGSAPLTLVESAVAARRRAAQEEGEVDEFWCVFDVEWPKNHPNLAQATRLASLNNINLAISNPCFELWLILHFKKHTGWLDNNAAKKLRSKCDGGSGKGVKTNLYLPKIQLACERAKQLNTMHAGNGTQFPHDNPSSGMYRLVKSAMTGIETIT